MKYNKITTMYDYLYFIKVAKSTSVILCLKLPRVLKFTLAGKEFHTPINNSFGKKKPCSEYIVVAV